MLMPVTSDCDQQAERLLGHRVEVVERVEHEGHAVGGQATGCRIGHALGHRIGIRSWDDERHKAADGVSGEGVEQRSQRGGGQRGALSG